MRILSGAIVVLAAAEIPENQGEKVSHLFNVGGYWVWLREK